MAGPAGRTHGSFPQHAENNQKEYYLCLYFTLTKIDSAPDKGNRDNLGIISRISP